MSGPKPEGNWVWRRTYTYALTGGLLAVAGVANMDAAIWGAVIVAGIYLVTPSVTEILKGLRIWRGGE